MFGLIDCGTDRFTNAACIPCLGLIFKRIGGELRLINDYSFYQYNRANVRPDNNWQPFWGIVAPEHTLGPGIIGFI